MERSERKWALCCLTTATLMSLFECVSKHSMRFYHMPLFWTPPCSALLYSVCTASFQSDSLSLSLHPSFFFLFFFLIKSFFLTLTSLSHLFFDIIFVGFALLYENKTKKTMPRSVCPKKTPPPHLNYIAARFIVSIPHPKK